MLELPPSAPAVAPEPVLLASVEVALVSARFVLTELLPEVLAVE